MPEPTFHSLITERRARIAILGSPSTNTETVWIVFHGYRQLSQYFIRKFSPLVDEKTVIFAPEGLSRFYLPGHQRVGASWMTKEDRLNEIEDQQVYLKQVLAYVQSFFPDHTPKLCILGFSQGAATAWRWVLQQKLRMDAFVIWASKPPEEYSEKMDKLLQEIPLYLVYGDKDQFISSEQGKALENHLLSRYPSLLIKTFEGQHDIDPDTLTSLGAELDRHFQQLKKQKDNS